MQHFVSLYVVSSVELAATLVSLYYVIMGVLVV